MININFIPDDTVTNDGHKLKYYCNQQSSILIILLIFINLILHMAWENHGYYFGLWDLPTQTFRRTENCCQRCPATFNNKIA